MSEDSRAFRDFAVLQRGFDLPVQDRTAGDIPVVASNGVVGWHSDAKVRGPGVITGRSGTIGKVMVLQEDFWPLNTTLYVKDFKGNIPQYVGLVLETMNLPDHAGGSTVPSLNRNVLDDVPVFCPPLPVQRRIVDLMTHLDAHIANLQAERECVFEARMAHLASALGGHGDSETRLDGWKKCCLGDLAEWHGGLTPSMSEPAYWSPSDVPWISSKAVLGTVLARTEKSVSWRALDETSLKLVDPGSTVVVVRSGILIHTLPVAYVPFACTVNQDVKVGSPHEDVDGRFLTLIFEAHATEFLSKYRKTGTTVQSLNFSALLAHPLHIPPFGLQREIADLIFEYDRIAKSLDAEIGELSELRGGLLGSLLAGEVVLPDEYAAFVSEVA